MGLFLLNRKGGNYQLFLLIGNGIHNLTKFSGSTTRGSVLVHKHQLLEL